MKKFILYGSLLLIFTACSFQKKGSENLFEKKDFKDDLRETEVLDESELPPIISPE